MSNWVIHLHRKQKYFIYGWTITTKTHLLQLMIGSWPNYHTTTMGLAEERISGAHRKETGLKSNAKDVLCTEKHNGLWQEDKIKRTRLIATSTPDYDWVTETLKPGD